MPQRAEAIRVRVTSRKPELDSRDLRRTFWAPLTSNEDVSNLEARLCRGFGPALKKSLVESLSEPLRTLEDQLSRDGLSTFERMFEFGPPGRDWYRYQAGEAFSRFIEYRRDAFESLPELRNVRERLAAAAGVIFSTRIIGYSSLTFEVATASFDKLAKAFDGHFDELRVFLDAFVPLAFAEVFDIGFADTNTFDVSIPESAEHAFIAAAARPAARPIEQQDISSTTSKFPSSRERAEWLWRLANGSLLVPFAIALLVMFYGIRMLSDIRRTEDEALRPILIHQLELLREDRARFSINQVKDVGVPCAITSADSKNGKQ